MAEQLDLTQQKNLPPSTALTLSVRNLSSLYTQEVCPEQRYSSTPYAPPCVPATRPFPVPKWARKKMSGSDLCNAIAAFLVLLALLGAGLGLYKIRELQNDLVKLKQSTNGGQFIPALERQLGNWNVEVAMKTKKSAAHLTGPKNVQPLQLEWESSGEEAFVVGVEHSKEGLVITKDGLYFVYSEVLFRGVGCESKYLRHSVSKRTPRYLGGSMMLMDSRMTSNCRPDSTWTRSSYLGAVLKLTSDDRLYVNVSDVNIVSYDGSKTFFGLYML
ncbi:tumor necrosis factor ligand superfamily member 6-like [Ambystoma mexicanum]|uniref:tumor necrosis factor ligand superfamily member 6-like n=1 Tax=Ambystoma mexicanum TaxID=8296 RepID=UPI0037E989D7